MAFALVGVISSAQATPESEDAEAVGNALQSFATRLASGSDALGDYGDLAESLPLTDLAPGDPDALDLSNLLGDYFTPANLGTFASMSDLASSIDALDDDTGPLKIQFGQDASSPIAPGAAAVTATATSITIPIAARRAVSEPLEFEFGATSMNGGSLGVDFALDTTLTLTVDPSQITDADTAPATAVSLAPPTINLCANATGSVGVFTARFGFTDLKVSTDNPETGGTTENATLHACADVVFTDPDSTGGITGDEWASHALTELATAEIVDAPGTDLAATFYADASLIDGDAFTEIEAADASIAFNDDNLANGFTTPTPTLGALGDWDNISAGDVANGLAQFVASLSGSQSKANGPLPFLKKGLSETFEAVKPLTDYTARLTSAEVGCGTEPGDADSFPSGLTDNLAAGTLVYCRAKTQLDLDDGTVAWTLPAGVSATAVSGQASDATLGNASTTPPGPSPTADAVFEMTAADSFDVELSWDSDTGAGTTTMTAIPRPGTAQELFQKLAAAAGLDTSGGKIGYSSATKSLTFRLQKDNFDPAAVSMNASFGDLLRNTTNLSGLQDALDGTASTSFSADVSGVDFDVTFGVLLLPDTSDITPLRGTATGGAGNTLTDTGANFTDGVNDPRLGQVVKNTTDGTQCTIASVAATTLTCPSGGTWSAGDAYDVDGGLVDRFYVKVDSAQPELSVDALAVSGTVALTGKLGFLEVEAGGNGGANTFEPGTALGIGKADASKPVIRLDINTPETFTIDTNGSSAGGEATVADSIGVADLLFHLDDAHLDAVCNLKATAGLGVSASVDGSELASGNVAVNWPTVFEADSCEPDFSTLAVTADADFTKNLKDFDPFPSVSGKHTADGPPAPSTQGSTNLHDATKNFEANALNGDNLLNLTLRNKTTGASCIIVTVDPNELECTLSGGTRSSDTANANKWKFGDEYEVEGNALAFLGIILDHLDELVEQVDNIDPGLTEKEIPLVGVSTKDIVAKIQSIKQTIDELRGSPLAEIDCSQNPDGTNSPTFDLQAMPDNTIVWCRAISTVEPDSVVWTAKETVGSVGNLTVGAAALPGGGAGQILETVGPDANGTDQDDRVPVTVTDNDGTDPLTTIEEWQVKVEFTDAAGNHTAEFPTSAPPTSLQDLEQLIGEKLGVENVLKLDLLDLPAAGAGAKTSGTATGGSTADNVLEDSGANFPSLAEANRPDVGNLLVNKTDNRHCTITLVGDDTLTCEPGSAMQWSASDAYEVVGNGTKDLIVRLGVGFCSGAGLCEATDRSVPPIEAPLNVSDDFADIVAVETQGDIALQYDASAQLDIGIPIKLDLTPDIVVLDTTGAEVEAKLDASDIGLEASIGPLSVKLGSTITDTDPVTDGDQPGVGVGKVGAKLKVGETADDAIADNNTFTFGDYFSGSNLDVAFTGQAQDCDAPAGAPVEATGHACALLNVEAAGQNFADPIKIECNIGSDPICNATLPPTLQALINGEPLDWTLLLQALPEILANLEQSLDGAAQDVHIPLIGDSLDAGADVVGAFNDGVVVPLADLAAQLTAAGDQDGDGDVDAYDLSKLARQFVLTELGPSGADLLRNTNGVPGDPNADGDIDDIVITPLCGSPAVVCADGEGVTSNLIKDFRVTFKIGQAIDGDVPFDIGLRGLPVRLTGGVHGAGSWSLLVDFGLSAEDGAYIVANGKAPLTGKTEKRPFDADTTEPPDGTNEAHTVVKFLQDDDTTFTGVAELGMWLQNTTSGQGCRVTKIETHTLWCDDFGTSPDVEGIDWHGTDGYELRARHAPDTPGVGGASELSLSASVTMGDLPGDAGFTCTDDDHDYSSAGGDPAYLSGFSPTRCLAGELAFLAVTIRDTAAGDDCDPATPPTGDADGDIKTGQDPTALCLTVGLDFQKSGAERVGISDLISGDFDIASRLRGDANIDVRFRTGLNVNQSAGFPSVLGKFHLYWGFEATPSAGLNFDSLDVSFDGLNLDAGKFISEFLTPIVKQVKKITGPLMPVVETLQGEVPIISDLSKLVGEGPVTVLDVLEAVSGNDLSLLRSILQFVRFVNTLPSDGNLLISLGGAEGGSFDVTEDRASQDQPLPESAADGITKAADTQASLIDDFAGDSDYGSIDDAPDECDSGRGSTFGVCGLTFPFLGDAGQIFGVLMGKDATLVRYDAGTFGAGAGFGFCFPPILIGPVPVQICIGGSFRVEGRFAIGYDTSGLRKVLEGGTGTHLLDGIFLDDYDANGAEVPEVKFVGTVYAEGAISVYIFKVGIRGEVIFTTSLDLHEDDPQDGKLRIEEIISRISNPLCLFDVSGKIEAALSAFVEIDLFITSIEFSIEIVRITLLEFNLDVCEPEPPVLARVDEVAGVERLILHIGLAEASKRNVAEDEIDETFVVRQMESYSTGPNSGKTRFSVTAFGIQQDYFLTTAKVGTANAVLIANADTGDDTISLLPGGNSGTSNTPNAQNPPVPFTLRADISAGDGADEITTGDGNDEVDGDPGNDRLLTNGGDDTIRGGTENDKIDAGFGDDSNVHGNDGVDVINGGKGADNLFGDAGDDIVSAGPDSPTATSVDQLHGGVGNDTLTGDGGADKLWGDEDLDFNCDSDGADTAGDGNNNDTLIGADGNDELHGGAEADQLDGGNGDDTMCGGGGPDEMVAGAGKDTAEGGSGDDNIVGGTDNSPVASGGDLLNGDAGRDYMLGDEGTLTRSGATVTVALAGSFVGNDTINGGSGDDFMWGQGGTDAMNGDANDDEMRGGLAVDTMHGNDGDDELYGEDADDVMFGDAQNDLMRGGTGIDTMEGNADSDEMYGDSEADVIRGGAADDLIRGGGGDDKIEGNGNSSSALPLDDAMTPIAPVNFDLHLVPSGTNGWAPAGGGDGDVIYGDANEDDIVGGSQGTPAEADGGDTILGNAAQDVILGDDGDVSRPGGTDPDGTTIRSVSLRNPGTDGGADYIQGNDENDDVYAGGAGDLVHGDLGDDYVEGNGGADGDPAGDHLPVAAIGLYGDAGQDDLVGGTSQGTGGIADGADDIWGGQGADVATGDNADVTRAAGSDCPAEPNGSAGYDCNTFRADTADTVIRRIQLADVATTGGAAPAGSAGGDTIGGQDGHDRLYGQGGDDWIEGGGNDDFAFGNADADTIFGGDGQDDLVGGTGRTDSADQSSAADGRLDAGDIIHGEGDFDAIAGDNARMVRQTQDGDTSADADSTGLWKANTFNSAVDRLIALIDVGVVGAPAGAGTSGNDQLLGGAADDTVYGQGGNDGISGGADQDLLEGNANGTGNAPDPAGTYGGSWPAFAGDVIHGDAGADDIAGGTGWIYRMAGGVETADPVAASVRIGADGRLDGGDTLFGDGGGDALAGDNTVIERALTGAGAWILDDLHSPDALGVVRRVLRQRDVATVANLAPLTNGTSGGDTIYGNDGVDVAYGQGGEDAIQGNAGDDHLEGSANDDTITGNEGRDDVIGGTGRTFSNDESTAAAGRIDNPAGDDAANDVLHGGDGLGGVASDDDDVIAGDNTTIDRTRGTLGAPGAELNRLPFNGAWGEATWDEPNILRVVRLLDLATTADPAPETNGTSGEDTINGEANEDVLFGQGGADTIKGDDADLDGADLGDAGADDYIEGNGGADLIHGNLGEDDITGGGSAAIGVLDANRDGTFDPARSGETLRDGNDLIAGDNGDGAAGDNDVIAGDNARIHRPLAGGDWRVDAQRKDLDTEPGAQLRDVFLFDIELVGTGEPGDAAIGESGVDTISGNGGEDILIGQGNGAVASAFGNESGVAGPADCQDATGGPGSGALAGSEEAPNGDNDNDDLPDLNDPQCRTTAPGDTILGEAGEDYVEGNQGSDNTFGGAGEDDVVGGSSSNSGHLNVILPPADRDAGFAPGAIADGNRPFNLNDGHDVVEGNEEDDIVTGDNAFVDRYTGAAGAWLTMAGPGAGPFAATDRPNSEPARGAYTATDMVRRDVTTRTVKESAGAFGNDYVRGGGGKDDVYGLLGNDWLEGNEDEDAIVGDMGKIVDNQLGGPTPDTIADPPLNRFVAPPQPFLGATLDYAGTLKREVTLYAFDESQPATAGIGHDVALGGEANDAIHTGPGEDLANGNAGDDRLWLGDNFTATTAVKGKAQALMAHDRVDAGWGGSGHDHLWGGYGADYLDVRPRSEASAPGVTPTSDPETWFQAGGGEASHNGVVYAQESFEGFDYLYGGWDQDTMQANEGDNGPKPGDRLLDWSGVYNGYYLCPSTYGDWVSTRSAAPGLLAFLQAMSQGFGATTTATAGTSGFRETAIVFQNEHGKNTNPIHPDTPAHFTCGPGVNLP